MARGGIPASPLPPRHGVDAQRIRMPQGGPWETLRDHLVERLRGLTPAEVDAQAGGGGVRRRRRSAGPGGRAVRAAVGLLDPSRPAGRGRGALPDRRAPRGRPARRGGQAALHVDDAAGSARRAVGAGPDARADGSRSADPGAPARPAHCGGAHVHDGAAVAWCLPARLRGGTGAQGVPRGRAGPRRAGAAHGEADPRRQGAWQPSGTRGARGRAERRDARSSWCPRRPGGGSTG